MCAAPAARRSAYVNRSSRGCAAAEQRDGVAAARVGEQQVGQVARARARPPGRDEVGANTPAASHEVVYSTP